MTKSTLTSSHNLQNWCRVVSTFCQGVKVYLNQKVGLEGTLRIGPVLEVTTSYLQGKYAVEIRIESVNKDNSHSWVRISHGLNKLVADFVDKEYDDNEKETCETKTEASACSSTRTEPIRERIWTDIEPGAQSNQAYPVAKKLNTLLRHGQLPREEHGAIEFWRLKDCLRYEFEHSQYWSDEMWKSKMAGGGGNKRKISTMYWLILYFRALHGHSGRNPIDPSLQDNASILDNFFEYISHIGCAISSHSTTT